MTPEISIVVGTKNRPESIRRFLQSVRETVKVPHEVVICDASDEPCVKDGIWDNGEVIVMRESPPLGHIRGYNKGFAVCRAPLVVWFNDDCQLLPGWCKAAIDFMQSHEDIDIGIIYFRDHPNGEAKAFFEYQTLYNVPYANFAIVKRWVGDSLKWFSEKLGKTYGADTDFCFRALCNGHGIAPIQDSKVLHFREIDEERHKNYLTLAKDRELFDEQWVPRVSEVQAAWEKWRHMTCPQHNGV